MCFSHSLLYFVNDCYQLELTVSTVTVCAYSSSPVLGLPANYSALYHFLSFKIVSFLWLLKFKNVT